MKVVIPAAQRHILKSVLDCIDTSYLDSTVCWIIDKTEKTLTVISGQKPCYALCTIHLDAKSPHIKDTQFAIDGSVCKQLLNYFPLSTDDVVLDIEMSGSQAKVVEIMDTSALHQKRKGSVGLCRCNCQEVTRGHLSYLEGNSARPMTKIPKATIQSIIQVANMLSPPFDLLEFNKSLPFVRVQRDCEIEEKALPSQFKVTLDLVLTPGARDVLSELCKGPLVEDIGIAQQGEELTFRTTQRIITCSVSGAEFFTQNNSDRPSPKKFFVINLNGFINILKKWTDNHKLIKKADDVILYLDDANISAFSLTGPFKFDYPLDVYNHKTIDSDCQCQIFHFSIRELLQYKSKKLTAATKTKIVLLQQKDGKFKLGIYSNFSEKYPKYSIAIEKAEHYLPTIQEMHKTLMVNRNNGNEDLQRELFSPLDAWSEDENAQSLTLPRPELRLGEDF